MADTESKRKRYRGEAVDVSFDPMRCRHAAECVRGLGAVFDTDRRPWILPGDLHVTGPGGVDEQETRAAVCSCGSTANSPYCDGSGTCADWPHPRATEPQSA
jgi:uncharacterized Fe-S cluster protein YjdI